MIKVEGLVSLKMQKEELKVPNGVFSASRLESS